MRRLAAAANDMLLEPVRRRRPLLEVLGGDVPVSPICRHHVAPSRAADNDIRPDYRQRSAILVCADFVLWIRCSPEVGAEPVSVCNMHCDGGKVGNGCRVGVGALGVLTGANAGLRAAAFACTGGDDGVGVNRSV